MESRALFRAISVLLSVVASFMLACMLAGLAFGEGAVAVRSFAPPVAAGYALFVASLFLKREAMTMSNRSGYLFVTLSWVCSAALGAIPFVLSPARLPVPDALFEAMSGFTTTGATVIRDLEIMPKSILLWRATTHWLGGMGIVVLTVAIFPLLGISGKALMEAEAPGPQVDKFTPRLSDTAAILWRIYLGLTVALTLLLILGGMSPFDAVTHSFATMATGGFSTRNASVGAFNSPFIDVVLTAFMLIAGMNFALHWKALTGKFREVARDGEWRAYMLIFAVATAGVFAAVMKNSIYADPLAALRHSGFQVASILTTTGFTTADFAAWPSFAQGILFAVMFVGGCAGSTGGGIKVSRILTLFKMALSEMRYLLNPRGVFGIFVNGTYMRKVIVYDIAAMVYLYLGSIIVSTLVVSWGGFDVLTSVTSTLATLGNIGPGLALAGPANTYAFFPGWIKLWFFFVMLLGRLEVYTVAVIFTRSFWKR